jgi:hypothetical protein
MELNWYIVLASGLIPNIVGFLWYGPLLEKVWIKESGVNPDRMNDNMVIKILFTLLSGVLLAFLLTPVVIHQFSVASALSSPEFEAEGSAVRLYFQEFMTNYGGNFRTFQHGALHGFILGLLASLSLIGCSALYENKSWKYIFIHVGYWTICATIMGGIICAFA